MKNKVVIFLLGFLVGAVVAIAGCFIYGKVTRNDKDFPDKGDRHQMMEQERPSDDRFMNSTDTTDSESNG